MRRQIFCSSFELRTPQPIDPRAVLLSLTSLTTILFPRLPELPINALPIPAPKPVTRPSYLASAFSVGSFRGEFSESPPGIEGDRNFVWAEMRDGDIIYSCKLPTDSRKNDYPVMFIWGRRLVRDGESAGACFWGEVAWRVLCKELPWLRSKILSGEVCCLKELNTSACWRPFYPWICLICDYVSWFSIFIFNKVLFSNKKRN